MCISRQKLAPFDRISNLNSKSGLTEINKGSKPRLSHVVQRFNRRLSYVLVACHPVNRIPTTIRGSQFQGIREKAGLSKTPSSDQNCAI